MITNGIKYNDQPTKTIEIGVLGEKQVRSGQGGGPAMSWSTLRTMESALHRTTSKMYSTFSGGFMPATSMAAAQASALRSRRRSSKDTAARYGLNPSSVWAQRSFLRCPPFHKESRRVLASTMRRRGRPGKPLEKEPEPACLVFRCQSIGRLSGIHSRTCTSQT